MYHRIIRIIGYLLVAFVAQGCTKQVRTRAPKQVVKMGPTVFTTKGGKVVGMAHDTPEQLFNKGANAYKSGSFKKASQYYGMIVQYHQRSEQFLPALYNYALTLEKLQSFAKAALVYRQVLVVAKDKETLRDAKFRLGASLSKAKKWKEAELVYFELNQLKDLGVNDKLEVMARLGVVYHEQKRITLAIDMFRRTVSAYRRASKSEFLGNDFFTSLAQFRLGMIYDKRFRERKFRLERAKMKQDLDAKAGNLLTAQAHYIRTIRLRHPDWVVAALFRIGDMYRQMFEDLLKAPVPKDLKKDELDVYKKMLKKRIRVLLDKANYAFERNIRAAQTLGLQKSAWVVKTRKQMQAIRDKIIKEYYSQPPTPEPTASSQPAAKRVSSSNTPPK